MASEKDHALKCECLLEAIDFFSQVLHPEQLAEYGYAYIREALGLKSSYIFLRNSAETELIPCGTDGTAMPLAAIQLTDQVKRLATKVGVVLTTDLALYLPEALMMSYAPNFLMPLIVADELIGVIISNDWHHSGEMDIMFAEALKKLVNNAFYTGIQMEKNHEYRKQMDRKLYDQMLLHQLVEVAISEREIEQVIKTCVDGLRELTASAQTSFCLLDAHSGKIAVKHYADLINFKKVHGEVAWNRYETPKRMTFSVKAHQDELKALFGSFDLFERLESQYVILLKSNPVIGFVTLGEPLGTQVYTQSTFDLIESIMSTICIAIENASHIGVLNQQKSLLNQTVDAMTQLGDSIKTVNSATDLDELSTLLFQSIDIHAGVDAAALAVKLDENTYCIRQSTDPRFIHKTFSLSSLGVSMLERGLVLDLTAGSMGNYLEGFEADLSEHQTLLAPIDVVRMAESHQGPEGLLIGLNLSRCFLNYELKYVETLASSVAPVMRQLREKEVLEEAQDKTDAHKFLEALQTYELHKQELWMDYKVYFKTHRTRLFEAKPKLVADRPTYQLGNLSCCFAYEEEPFDEAHFEGVLEGTPDEIIEALELMCG